MMDQENTKTIVAFGEVLLRLSTEGFLKFSQANQLHLDYGGSEMNVLSTLSNLGTSTRLVSGLPDNDLGKAFLGHLRKCGIDTRHMVTLGDRIGLYFLEKGVYVRGGKIIYDRKDSAFTKIKPGTIDWEAVFDGADWFHWSGITPGVSENTAETCLEAIRIAKKKGLTVSADFNYRDNLWNYGKSAEKILEPMITESDVILAGEYACSKYFSIQTKGETQEERTENLATQLMKRFPNVRYLSLTHRESLSADRNLWSGCLVHKEKIYTSKTYDIQTIVDRVGAGDSFMGGLIYGLRHYDPQKAIDFATAASCLKHTIYGDANLSSLEDIETLMAGNTYGRIIR